MMELAIIKIIKGKWKKKLCTKIKDESKKNCIF